MSTHNKKRTERIKKKTDNELEKIVRSGSLSAAAAQYEISRRYNKQKKEGYRD